MKHTYILEEGTWKATGRYYDEYHNCTEISGETQIIHNNEVWILDGYMELKLDDPVKYFNKYTIQPVDPEKDYTFWSSENPALGTLLGKFMFTGDTILSSYHSEDGQYSGSESLILVDPRSYKNRGFAFHNKAKLSSWAVDLYRTF